MTKISNDVVYINDATISDLDFLIVLRKHSSQEN
jgi:hypothetical protein